MNISYEVFPGKSPKLFLLFIGQPCRRHTPSLPPSLPPVSRKQTNCSILLLEMVTKCNKHQNKQTKVEQSRVVHSKADIFFNSRKPWLGRRNQMELEYLFQNKNLQLTPSFGMCCPDKTFSQNNTLLGLQSVVMCFLGFAAEL